jgi:type I restriction enzyme M protein
VQLIDAREIWTTGGSEESKRSLGDKRRHMAASQIAEVVRIYGRLEIGGQTKTFDNEDFDYTRVAIERPLRLRYQMTTEGKARFLEACPQLLDDVQAIDKVLGREPATDWNAVSDQIEDVLRERSSRWKAQEKKLFRVVFCERHPNAQPVLLEGRQSSLEPDPDLRDFENVPLKKDIDAYFEQEVRPHVPDAWMDRSKDKVGYEITFNRHFYEYKPPRSLEVIDRELKLAEDAIVRLLAEVTS